MNNRHNNNQNIQPIQNDNHSVNHQNIIAYPPPPNMNLLVFSMLNITSSSTVVAPVHTISSAPVPNLGKRYNDQELKQKTDAINAQNQERRKRKFLEDQKFEKLQQTIKEENDELKVRKKAKAKNEPVPNKSLTTNNIFNLVGSTKPNSINNLLTTSETPKIPEGANTTVRQSLKF